MRAAAPVLLLCSALALAVCPLQLPPSEACLVTSPSCALFSDADEDELCDNPAPWIEEDEEEPEVAEEPAEDAPEGEGESEEPPEDDRDDSTTGPGEGEGESPPTAGPEEEELPPSTPADTAETAAGDTAAAAGDDLQAPPPATFPCPLQLPPEEACPEEAPRCALYSDPGGDGYCDNPLVEEEAGRDTASAPEAPAQPPLMEPESEGCPLGLPPAAACPTVEDRLCPHYMGRGGCGNPGGLGRTRVLVVFIGTLVLLTVSTYLRRKLRGRRKSERRRRTIAHVIVHLVSLGVLGFAVQGCYCQLGMAQYVLLPGGLAFMGGFAVAAVLLPMVWALFFGRVFCGWVCPFGALQGLLGRLGLPRLPSPGPRLHNYLVTQKYVLVVLFYAAVIMAGAGLLGRLVPGSLFCLVDPFHTVFSFFAIGSLVAGVALMAACVLLPRFFCRYLCFYGAILAPLGKACLFGLLSRRGEDRACDSSFRDD